MLLPGEMQDVKYGLVDQIAVSTLADVLMGDGSRKRIEMYGQSHGSGSSPLCVQ